jgi:hypothetical protein
MLRVLSAVYKLIGALVGILAIAGFAFSIYVALSRPEAFYPSNLADAYLWILGAGTVFLLIGLLLALMIFGGGVLLDLYMGLEENTRASSLYLRRLWQRDQSRRREGPPPSQPISRPIQTPAPPVSRPISTPPTAPASRTASREPHAIQMPKDSPAPAAPASPGPIAPVAAATLPAMATPASPLSVSTEANTAPETGKEAAVNGSVAPQPKPDDGPPAFILENPPPSMRSSEKK